MMIARPSLTIATLVPRALAIVGVIIVPAPRFVGVPAGIAAASRLIVLALAFALFLVLGAVGVVVGSARVALGLTLLGRVVLFVLFVFVHFVGEELVILLGVG